MRLHEPVIKMWHAMHMGIIIPVYDVISRNGLFMVQKLNQLEMIITIDPSMVLLVVIILLIRMIVGRWRIRVII